MAVDLNNLIPTGSYELINVHVGQVIKFPDGSYWEVITEEVYSKARGYPPDSSCTPLKNLNSGVIDQNFNDTHVEVFRYKVDPKAPVKVVANTATHQTRAFAPKSNEAWRESKDWYDKISREEANKYAPLTPKPKPKRIY